VAYLYDLFWAAVPDVCNMLLLMMFAHQLCFVVSDCFTVMGEQLHVENLPSQTLHICLCIEFAYLH